MLFGRHSLHITSLPNLSLEMYSRLFCIFLLLCKNRRAFEFHFINVVIVSVQMVKYTTPSKNKYYDLLNIIKDTNHCSLY